MIGPTIPIPSTASQSNSPLEPFKVTKRSDRRISLSAPSLGAAIYVYAAEKAGGFNPKQFVSAIEKADRIREVTYRAGGGTWFVRSGFYSRTDAGEPVFQRRPHEIGSLRNQPYGQAKTEAG